MSKKLTVLLMTCVVDEQVLGLEHNESKIVVEAHTQAIVGVLTLAISPSL